METIDEFLRGLSTVDLLSPEDEQAIIESVQQKGTDCEEMAELERANSRFIASLLLQYQGQGRTFWELIEAGNEGLRKAALQYKRGICKSFAQFAVPYVRKEMKKKLEVEDE